MAHDDEVLSPEESAQELEGFIREWRHLVRDLEKREAVRRQDVEKATSDLADVTARISRMKTEYPVILLSEYVLAVEVQKQLKKQLSDALTRERSGLKSADHYRNRIVDAEGQIARLRARLGTIIPFPLRFRS